MKKILAAGAVIAAALSSPAMSAELITNGGFETGSFAGWILGNVGGGTEPVVIEYNNAGGYPVGAFGEAVLSNATPGSGNYLAYFSSDTANPDSLTQTVNVTNGQLYALSFDYYVPQNGYNNPNDATLKFLIDGAPAGGTLQAGSFSGTATKTWFTFTTNYQATSTGAVDLEFQFVGLGVTAADFGVDNVSMQAVPEPASWALMIGGFAIVGSAMRRRRTDISFA